ncbi:hypothetical protein ABT354_36070 [Streptomyces sp. NPDC000594]|uniref:hypothetical protein n=1 Tax=Streptomyces sp. NPDC000594 TaxID=3154261 RepID=UPI0033314DD6
MRAEPGEYEGWTTYHFRGFTGREERPEMPSAVWRDRTVTSEERWELGRQYDSARVLWSKARLRLRAVPVLRKAAPLWEAWQRAQAALHQTFRAFWDTSDGMWRAQLLKLTDAERAAVEAATAWDGVAGELARLAEDQVREAGEDNDLALTVVAREAGLDASGWDISPADSYNPYPGYWQKEMPLVAAAGREIAEQRERLAEVAALAGDITATTAPAARRD